MTKTPDLLATLLEISKYVQSVRQTEADTRARMIDPLLSALGWCPEEIRREPYDNWVPNPGFVDYLLLVHGQPYLALEAKRSASSFVVPERLAKSGATTFAKIQTTAPADLVEAIAPGNSYSQHSGAPYACTTNGHQFCFLKPSHRHRPLSEAKVVLFHHTLLASLSEVEAAPEASAVVRAHR